jgi:hypothetical protein
MCRCQCRWLGSGKMELLWENTPVVGGLPKLPKAFSGSVGMVRGCPHARPRTSSYFEVLGDEKKRVCPVDIGRRMFRRRAGR